MNKVSGVYSITNPIGEVYIGQTVDMNQRMRLHKCLSVANSEKLRASIIRYGFQSHEFKCLHQLPVDSKKEILLKYEEFFISQLREGGIVLLNISNGAKHSEETKKKQSRSRKLWKYDVAVNGKHIGKHMRKPVLQYTKDGVLIKEWGSPVDATKETGIQNTNIVVCANGRRKSAGGFVWKYKNQA